MHNYCSTIYAILVRSGTALRGRSEAFVRVTAWRFALETEDGAVGVVDGVEVCRRDGVLAA